MNNRPTYQQLLAAWLLGALLSYFAVAYLENFYPSPLEVALLTVPIHGLISLFVYYLIGKIINGYRAAPTDAIISAIVYTALIVFVPAMYFMAKPFVNLFDATAFQISASNFLGYMVAWLLAIPLSFWLRSLAYKQNWIESRFGKFVDANLDGLLVALLFFAVYLIFASIFNRPSYDADDMFFDADGNLYRWRFATEVYEDYYWRPAHPFVLLIIRPLVAVFAFLFRGDTLFAAFTLNALTGALCVFLVWYFVQNSVGNRSYALLLAVLFGVTPTQLVFGSILETYIYLSAIALIFLVLLLKDKPLPALVLAGLVAFGITISNVGQTFFAHFFVKRNIKQIIIYGIIIGALVVPLSLLNNFIYPASQPYFWDFSTLEGEGHNQFPPTVQRGEYLARVMALHSFVAPEPLIIRDGLPFAKVWMFRASIKKDPMQIAQYESVLGNGLVIVWVGLLVLGGVYFLKNLFKQDNGYFLTFIATLLFNFALYMQYGKDTFLYATNWTYAIILFLALAWRELAGKRWLQFLLLIFVLLLLVNNSHMLYKMLEISAPTVHFPVWE